MSLRLTAPVKLPTLMKSSWATVTASASNYYSLRDTCLFCHPFVRNRRERVTIFPQSSGLMRTDGGGARRGRATFLPHSMKEKEEDGAISRSGAADSACMCSRGSDRMSAGRGGSGRGRAPNGRTAKLLRQTDSEKRKVQLLSAGGGKYMKVCAGNEG